MLPDPLIPSDPSHYDFVPNLEMYLFNKPGSLHCRYETLPPMFGGWHAPWLPTGEVTGTSTFALEAASVALTGAGVLGSERQRLSPPWYKTTFKKSSKLHYNNNDWFTLGKEGNKIRHSIFLRDTLLPLTEQNINHGQKFL